MGHRGYADVENRGGIVSIQGFEACKGMVEGNAAASLVDLGDGVLCLEFHSKMNSIGEDTLTLIDRAVERLNGASVRW